MTEDTISFDPGDYPVEKRGYFMGWLSNDKAHHYSYASYSSAKVVREMAPDLMTAAFGPLFPLTHNDNYNHVLNHVEGLDFDSDELQVYTHENPHGVVFFSNHIPQHPDLTYELVADHSKCTPEHCYGEDEDETGK